MDVTKDHLVDVAADAIMVEIILVSGLFYFFFSAVEIIVLVLEEATVVVDVTMVVTMAVTVAYGLSSFYSSVAVAMA